MPFPRPAKHAVIICRNSWNAADLKYRFTLASVGGFWENKVKQKVGDGFPTGTCEAILFPNPQRVRFRNSDPSQRQVPHEKKPTKRNHVRSFESFA